MKKFFSLIAIFIFVFAGGLTLVSCGKSEYSITVESPEHGVVYVDNKANVGEIVYFDAVPEDGYELTKITVNNRVITEDHFDMPAKDVVLRATFERKYNITITPSAHGTITILTTNYKGGDLVEFSANPENGYRLQYFDTNVSINYNFSIKDITYSFIMPNFDVVITPHFERVYSITIDKNIQHGNIFVQENAIANSDVTLTVQPESNYALQQLTINGVPYYTINNKCSFTMPAADVVISATFVPIEENKSFSITVVQPSHGNVSVNKTSAKYNEYVVVTLTPSYQYDIKQLLINGMPFEINNNPYSFPMPNHDITISAEFVKIGYGAISYNVTSMESVEDDSPFDEVYYKNNFINIDGDKLKCGYFDGEKYCVETLDFQIENSQIILDTNDPYLSQLTISMGYGNIIVSNDDVTLVYIATPDFNMPHGIYTSPEEINDNIVDLEYVFQENGNIISIANVEYDIPGYDLGKAYIYGNIMIIENVDYDLSNYNLYVGNLSRSAQSVGGFSWDFYNFYYDEFYQYFHDPKPFTYKSAFDETTYTYNNETLSEYPEEKDKFIRFTGNLVTFGAYIYESIEGYGYYEGFLYLEYLPATIDGNNITVDVLIPFSEQSLIITVTAQFSEDKQTLTVNFTDEVIEFHLTTNINFTYGTYQRSENYDTYTRIFIDVIDENGNVMETIKYENDGSPEEPYFIGKFKVFGNICILICTDATNGIYVGIGQISDNTALWSGMNYYTSYNNGLQMEEFSYNYTKIA